MTFQDRLIALLQEKSITKSKLLRDLGMNKGSILNWTQRGTVPSGDILERIAAYFSVSTDYLLGATDIKKSLSEDRLSDKDRELLELFNGLPPDKQEQLLELGEFLAQKPRRI